MAADEEVAEQQQQEGQRTQVIAHVVALQERDQAAGDIGWLAERRRDEAACRERRVMRGASSTSTSPAAIEGKTSRIWMTLLPVSPPLWSNARKQEQPDPEQGVLVAWALHSPSGPGSLEGSSWPPPLPAREAVAAPGPVPVRVALLVPPLVLISDRSRRSYL